MASRFTTPVLMKELMRQFDTVLTPLSRSASGPASSSAGSIEFATIAKDALQMRYLQQLHSDDLYHSSEWLAAQLFTTFTSHKILDAC